MKFLKSVASYQQAYDSKHYDVSAYHSRSKDVSLKDYAEALIMKAPRLVAGRFYYHIKRLFDAKPSKDLTPETLYLLVVSTGLARYVRADTLDLKYFKNLGMRTAIIDLNHDDRTAVPRPEANETSHDTMDRAQRACFLAVPIHYHSFVHFHAPTALAIYATENINKKLRKFIQRHCRYTLIYNNGGIDASSSDFFNQTLLPDYQSSRASDSIFARVQQYWNVREQTRPGFPLAREISNPENFEMDWQPEPNSGLEFEKKILSFYPYVRAYVEAQQFSAGDLGELSDWLSQHVYPVPDEIATTIIPLTYLIWSNSVVHSLEHADYYKWIDYARFGPKTTNAAWYRYFMNAFARPYGSVMRSEKLATFIPEIRELEGAEDCYVSIQF